MKLALAVVAVILALIALVLVVGWTLPVRHQVSREATYAAAPDSLFATLVRVAAFPTWRSGIRRIEVLPAVAGHRSFREVGKDGALTYVVDEEVPPRRLVTRIADQNLPFGGRWTYELAPSGAGTTLRITEDGEVYNPVYRFVSRFVLGHATTINQFLKDLGTVYSRADGR
jgi:uncharacterized protein YndB with AHSA1/START domain